MNQYLELFHNQRERICGNSLPVLNARREAAAAAFERLGFPSQKVERYKYTDVAAAFAPNYGISLASQPSAPAPQPSSLYGTLADVNADAITALNTMLVQDLAVIHIPAGVHKENPVQVTHTLRSTAPLMQNRRLLIIADAGAHVQVLLSERADEEQDFLTTQVTEVFVGEGAHVEIYDIESTHARCHRFHQLFADVATGGHFTHAAFTLSGGLKPMSV